MSAHFEIVTTDAGEAIGQPYHVRVIADNGEPILTSENLEHEVDAERVVFIVAEMFGLSGFSIGAVVRYADERSS